MAIFLPNWGAASTAGFVSLLGFVAKAVTSSSVPGEAGVIGRAGVGEWVGADKDAGTDHFAVIDEGAHGDVYILIGAEVSDGGDAGLESAERAFACEEDFDGGRIVDELLQHGVPGS